MQRGLAYIGLFLLLLLGPSAVRWVSFNGGSAADRDVPTYDPQAIEAVPTPESHPFEDEPEMGDGLVLLDQSHANNFTIDEISYLDGRLAARGYELLPYRSGDLAAALRAVDAFVVITPQEAFSEREVTAVTDFVARGGKLLLIGDPTRFTVEIEEDLFSFTVNLVTDKIPLNSLSNSFGVIFKDDYLYNTIESEGNFRNIIVDDGLDENGFTEGLESLVLYGAHSLEVTADGEAVLLGDDNTWSSATDRAGGLTLASLSANDRVMAIGDIHFLTEPYYTTFSNQAFIARIADFLTESASRDFVLSDFPFFFEDEAINLVYIGSPDIGPDVFADIIELQEAFRSAGYDLDLASAGETSENNLYVGLYNQAEDELADLLASADIVLDINPAILTQDEIEAMEEAEEAEEETEDTEADEPAEEAESEEAESEEAEEETEEEDTELRQLIHTEMGSIQMSGTSLIVLNERSGGRDLVVLAASNEGLQNGVARVLDLIPRSADDVFVDCLLQDNVAFCPSDVSGETVEAEILTGGEPEPAEDDEADDAEDEDDEADDAEDEDEEGEAEPVDVEGELQGELAIGDSEEGEMAEETNHLWTFEGVSGTAVDITVQGGEDLDAIVSLYDPNNILVETVDGSFTGGIEQIIATLEEDGIYTIQISDWFDNGGSYTITLSAADPDEVVVPPDEDDGEDPTDEDPPPVEEGTETEQGAIGLAETVEATLAENEVHLWTFEATEGQSVSIVVETEELDAILSLLSPDGEFINSSDAVFVGLEEISVVFDEAGVYTIRVEGFFGASGEYALSVNETVADDEEASGPPTVFVFGDDDGEPLSGGVLSIELLADFIDDTYGYEVTTWTTSEDGPLDAELLETYTLVIWDSGDYFEEDGFLGDDIFVLFEYLDAGGKLFINGSIPAPFTTAELAPISELVLQGDDSVLLEGFEDGQVITLDEPIEAFVAGEEFAPSENDEIIVFAVRGDNEEGAGDLMAMASDDADLALTAVFVPISLMPTEVQGQLLTNIFTWLDLE